MVHFRAGSKKIPSYRDAEIKLDASTSDRPEWCTVRYHGIFCPDNAYVVRLRWLVSTGAIINQLVGKPGNRISISGVARGEWGSGPPTVLQDRLYNSSKTEEKLFGGWREKEIFATLLPCSVS